MVKQTICKRVTITIVWMLVLVLAVATTHLPQAFANANFDPQTSGPSKDVFKDFNPLLMFGNEEVKSSLLEDDGSIKPANFINRALSYIFPLAGMILFVMLVWGGVEVLATSATKKSMEAGTKRATTALLGFLLLFVAYWLIQIIETIFGITIL